MSLADLTAADRRSLLALARLSVAARASGAAPPEVPATPAVRAGAFVTLHRDGQLRGCIGSLDTERPVTEIVRQSAAAAAAEDPRFPPVAPDEVGALDIEVSVLGALEPLDPVDPAGVEIGRHGLVVEEGLHRGLLLPQVATEWGWDATTFLSQACAKAGLPTDAWRRGARVFRFEAVVFGEGAARP
jgi:AmmeMemoRadiSam system protein A